MHQNHKYEKAGGGIIAKKSHPTVPLINMADLTETLCEALPGDPDVEGGVDLLAPALRVREVCHLLKGRHQAVRPDKKDRVMRILL